MNRTVQSTEQLRAIFLEYLQANPFAKAPHGLYDPVDYILGIGGKRIRPVLALLAGQLFEAPLERILPVAMAVEVFHNFTLLHDDIMDDSPLRRGQATVHEKWDVNTAILSGDLMLIKAYECLLYGGYPENLPQMMVIFNKVATAVCEGQQYDVEFENSPRVSIPDYLKMIELKTAVLLAGALGLGALAAGAEHLEAGRLYDFGKYTGIAFQLQDDLLDTFGTEAQIGKKVGNDIVRNKKTFLYLKALELAQPKDRQQLIDHYASTPANPSEKVAAVTAIMQSLGIPRLVAELRDTYQAKAYDYLNAVKADEAAKQPLIQLAESLLQRKS